MTNFIGRESMTDLMSFAAAADDPDIFGLCECVVCVVCGCQEWDRGVWECDGSIELCFLYVAGLVEKSTCEKTEAVRGGTEKWKGGCLYVLPLQESPKTETTCGMCWVVYS